MWLWILLSVLGGMIIGGVVTLLLIRAALSDFVEVFTNIWKL